MITCALATEPTIERPLVAVWGPGACDQGRVLGAISQPCSLPTGSFKLPHHAKSAGSAPITAAPSNRSQWHVEDRRCMRPQM